VSLFCYRRTSVIELKCGYWRTYIRRAQQNHTHAGIHTLKCTPPHTHTQTYTQTRIFTGLTHIYLHIQYSNKHTYTKREREREREREIDRQTEIDYSSTLVRNEACNIFLFALTPLPPQTLSYATFNLLPPHTHTRTNTREVLTWGFTPNLYRTPLSLCP